MRVFHYGSRNCRLGFGKYGLGTDNEDIFDDLLRDFCVFIYFWCFSILRLFGHIKKQVIQFIMSKQKRYVVERLDDNGQIFFVTSFATRELADAYAKSMDKGHKQFFYVKEINSKLSH